MKVAVIGAAGVLGSSLTREARSRGFDVTAFDVLPKDRLGEYVSCGEPTGHFDVVVCVGGSGDSRAHYDEPRRTLALNMDVAMKALEIAALSSARLLLASTWEVYAADAAPVATELSPAHGANVYGATKIAVERFVSSVAAHRGLEVSAFRFGTLYGPGQRVAGVLPTFLQRAKDGLPLVIDDPAQQRQFTFLPDAASAMLDVAALAEMHPIYNVANDEVNSIGDIAHLVANRYAVPVVIGEPDTRRTASILRVDSSLLVSSTKKVWTPLETGMQDLDTWLDATQHVSLD